MFLRNDTVKLNVGGVELGGGSKISVQSMTNTDTRDALSTIEQIKRLEEVGCDIVRVAVPDMQAAESILKIKRNINIPLVADIHFDYKLALECIKNGVDKIRINPGNIGNRENTAAVVKAAKERRIPIRIGVNGGSLENVLKEKYGHAPNADAIVESAVNHIKILEDLDFGDIAVSLKSSDVGVTLKAYLKMAEICNYPLHVGITEAGTVFGGTIKSCAGMGAILLNGIGDTIRVSLTGDPCEEIKVGRQLLHSLDLGGEKMVRFVSCPSCGRCRIDLVKIANEIESRLLVLENQGFFKKPIHIAVMGCAVNGPGEASNADIGIAGGNGEALLFTHGNIITKIKSDDIAGEFIEYVKKYTCGN